MRKVLHLLSLLALLGFVPLYAQVTLQLPTTTVSCGEILYIPVTVENFDSLLGIQLTIEWNADAVTYVADSMNEVLIAGETALINARFANEGQLLFTWKNTEPLSLTDGDTLFLFTLQVLQSEMTAETIRFSNEKTAVSIRDIKGVVNPTLNNGLLTLSAGAAPPVAKNCPDTVFQYTTALSCEVAGLWEIPTFETCNGALTIQGSANLGTIFGEGSRLISYTATDELGNTAECSFVHIVKDTIAPVISNCPKNMEVNFSKEDGCDLSVTWAPPSFLERCSSSSTEVKSNFRPGDNFPVGFSLVTYTATDISGNISTCSFEIVVTGSDPITFQGRPENIVINALPDQCGATYDWGGPPATITGCEPITLISNYEPGSFFPVGKTVVEYVATDQINQRAIWSFSINVMDDQPMSVQCPSDIIINANGDVQLDSSSLIQSVQADNCGNYQLFFKEIEVLDNCPAAITRELVGGNKKNFSTGTTQMEYLIKNASGESTSCRFQISITEAPEVAISRSSDLACVETDLQLRVETEIANFYDTWRWTGPNNFSSQEEQPVIKLTLEASGRYRVVASSSISNCSASADMDIEVLGQPGLPVIEASQVTVCEGTPLSISTMASPNASYAWTGPNDFSSEEVSISFDKVSTENTGNYELTRTVEGCTSASAAIRIIVLGEIRLVDDVVAGLINTTREFEVIANDTFEASVPYTISVFPDPVNGSIVNHEDGSFAYTPAEGFVGTDQFAYEICYEACPDICASSIITMRTTLSDEKCTYPTFLSPNGDEENDVLIFSCNTSNTTESGIIVFNQWGSMVFKSFPYNNDWDGTYKGQPLPDGTYYYIYKRSADDLEPIKNYVTIFR